MSKKFIFSVSCVLFVALCTVVLVTVSIGKKTTDTEITPVFDDKSKQTEKPYCLLVTGEDRNAALCDVMMLVSLDPEKERICVLQLPRDTYAEYKKSGYRKLNGARNALGGTDGLADFLSETLGIQIDGYVSLDLKGFRRIVDAIGGVEVDVKKALYYSDPAQNLYIDLKPGNQILDGKSAEMFVRFRSGYIRGDLDRIDAQKVFLSALFNSLKSKITAENAYEVVNSLIDSVDTDVDTVMAVALGLKALSIDKSNLIMCTLPGEDIVSKKTGASFYIMSAKPTGRLLKEYFGKADDKIDEKLRFSHKVYPDFVEIYERDFDFKTVNADKVGQ